MSNANPIDPELAGPRPKACFPTVRWRPACDRLSAFGRPQIFVQPLALLFVHRQRCMVTCFHTCCQCLAGSCSMFATDMLFFADNVEDAGELPGVALFKQMRA